MDGAALRHAGGQHLARFIRQLIVAQQPAGLVHHLLRRHHRSELRQPVNDLANSRLVHVAHEVRREVDAVHQRAAVDPLPARVPSFHRRRVEQLLAHVLHLVKDKLKPGLRLRPVADQPHRSHHRLHRALHPLEPRVLERIGVEQHPQHRLDVVAGAEVLILQHLDRFWILRRGLHPRRHLRLVGNEVAVQVAGDESRRRRLLRDDVDDVIAVEVAGLAQERLGALVMVFGVVHELRVVTAVGLPRNVVRDGPTGERAGAFLYVVLGVVELAVHAHAHREQLQELPAVVLVDRALVTQTVIKEENHRRVARDSHQQITETAHSELSEHLDLVIGCRVALRLAVGGAQDAVPEQHHLLLKLALRVDHPERKIFRHATRLVAPLDEAPLRHVQVHAVVVHLGIEQLFDRRIVSLGGALLQFRVLSAKSGPTHQVGH